jgi:methionyl-tRNA formyltransferase
LRLVFAGTPDVAVTSLRALLESRHEVAAVVTRPDAPAGRGRRVEPSPVAQLARAAGLEVLTPARPREPEFLDRLRAIGPDCCPVTAYGALLPQAALDIPPHGWVNLHFSLLPAWRGAAPVQHAILHGDDITGATTFQLVAAMDAGPVYGVVTEPIRPGDTSGDLLGRLAESGSGLLVATLDAIEDGTVRAEPQPADGVSLAPKLNPPDARVDWKLPAHLIDRTVRACTPDPGAWTEYDGGRVKLWPFTLTGEVGQDGQDGQDGTVGTVGQDDVAARASVGPAEVAGLAPGELHVARGAVYVGTGSGPVRLGDVQAPGKRRMPAADWARGLRLESGDRPGFA